VITQNVDGLHALAGSRDVIEVHGTIGRARCLRCGTLVEGEELRALLPLPHCPTCGAIPKPDVVMFGELLPAAAFERAVELARNAALLLVVGSSLEVWPVAGLPEETLARGGRLAIVNRDPTSFDERASAVVHASAAETLAACAAELS
jgi:NAD-dependent deacetylase